MTRIITPVRHQPLYLGLRARPLKFLDSLVIFPKCNTCLELTKEVKSAKMMAVFPIRPPIKPLFAAAVAVLILNIRLRHVFGWVVIRLVQLAKQTFVVS
jgi:hypothetical protein